METDSWIFPDDISESFQSHFDGTGYRQQYSESLPKPPGGPVNICIEITESSSKIQLEELSWLAEEIITAGFKISLDDYGTEYSNLAILSAIDFNEIKLDKSLIESLETNEKSQVLVKYVIQMCRTLNHMIPIAEGIETEGQINILKDLGCCCGQGYFFSKPIPIHEFSKAYIQPEAKTS